MFRAVTLLPYFFSVVSLNYGFGVNLWNRTSLKLHGSSHIYYVIENAQKRIARNRFHFFLLCLVVLFWCQLPTFSLSQWTISKDSMQKRTYRFFLVFFCSSVLVYRIENNIFHLNQMHSCENWSRDWRYRYSKCTRA